MPGIIPKEDELMQFIVQTHTIDHIPVTAKDVATTLKIRRGGQLMEGESPVKNPYVTGHFDAFNFIFHTLIGSVDFPCKSLVALTNHYHSDTALWWLRELHTKVIYPVAQHFGLQGDVSAPKTYECGVYRCQPRMLAFTNAPEPEQIQQLLHLWLLDIATFHEQIKGKIHNPYGLSRSEAEQLYFKPLESQMFISCLQPFEHGNNQISRLVENALRLQWGLPWKMPQNQMKQLGEYQTTGFSKWLRRLKEAAGR